eukprot:ctg_750.g198
MCPTKAERRRTSPPGWRFEIAGPGVRCCRAHGGSGVGPGRQPVKQRGAAREGQGTAVGGRLSSPSASPRERLWPPSEPSANRPHAERGGANRQRVPGVAGLLCRGARRAWCACKRRRPGFRRAGAQRHLDHRAAGLPRGPVSHQRHVRRVAILDGKLAGYVQGRAVQRVVPGAGARVPGSGASGARRGGRTVSGSLRGRVSGSRASRRARRAGQREHAGAGCGERGGAAVLAPPLQPALIGVRLAAAGHVPAGRQQLFLPAHPQRALQRARGHGASRRAGRGRREQLALLRVPVHWGVLREADYVIEDTEVDLEQAYTQRMAAERDAGGGRGGGRARAGADAAAAHAAEEAAAAYLERSESIPLPQVWRSSGMLPQLEDLRARVQLSSTALPSVLFYTLLNSHGNINAVDVLSDGSALVAGCDDSAVRVFAAARRSSASSSAAEAALPAAKPEPTAPVENGPGDTATAATTTTAPASSLISAPALQTLVGHSGPVYGVHASADGRHCLSASEDGTVRLWDLQRGVDLVAYRGHSYPVWDVRFAPLGRYFVSVSHDRTALLYCTDRVSPLRILAGHMTDVDCVAWHPNCNYVATGSTDRTVRLWDVRHGDCVRIFCGHRAPLTSLAFAPDGRYLASGDAAGAVLVHDIAGGRRAATWVEHGDAVWGSVVNEPVRNWPLDAPPKMPIAFLPVSLAAWCSARIPPPTGGHRRPGRAVLVGAPAGGALVGRAVREHAPPCRGVCGGALATNTER